MTTAVYNRQNIALSASTLSPIDVRIDSDAAPEEVSQFLISLAGIIMTNSTTVKNAEHSDFHDSETWWSAEDYRRNSYGDEYACCDELGFETSYMGPRADHNHVF